MEKIEPKLIEGFILVNRFLQTHKLRYCLIGGIAAGFWGEPRFTKDMDFTVVSGVRDFKEIINFLKEEKFKFTEKLPSQVQITKKGSLEFLADLILAETDYQDWVVQRAISVLMFGVNVPICTPEDLIILKLIANRRQDLLDIENILKNHSMVLDSGYLKEWLDFWELKDRFRQEFGKDFPKLAEELTKSSKN